jgi:hypothetical protein
VEMVEPEVQVETAGLLGQLLQVVLDAKEV